MSTFLKIAVAESSLILRSGVVSVLRRLTAIDVEVVEVVQVAQLGETLRRHRPDMLIVNPSLLGVFSLQQVRAESGCAKMCCVALLTSLSDSCLTSGYDATISIYDSAEEIKEKLLKIHEEGGSPSNQDPLSAREREIIVGVVKGLTNKQIAERLFISTHTVITHRRNIAAKLQIHSPAGLTIYAIVNKLVELNDIKDTIYNTTDE